LKKSQNFSCAWLLASLVILFVIQPYLNAFAGLGIPIFSRLGGRVMLAVVYSLILLSAIRITSDKKGHLIAAAILAFPVIVSTWLAVAVPSMESSVKGFTLVLMFLFLSFTTARLLRYVIRPGGVSSDQVFGAISIYFLLGHGWAFVYLLLEHVSPGSFRGLESQAGSADLTYYSFVTLTTLGYGEIVPVTAQARSLAALEAVTGVLYIATLVSRLVSLYNADSRDY